RAVLKKIAAAYGIGALQSAAKEVPDVLRSIPETLKRTWQGATTLPGQAAGAVLNNPRAALIGSGALAGTALGGAGLHHLLSGGAADAASAPTEALPTEAIQPAAHDALP